MVRLLRSAEDATFSTVVLEIHKVFTIQSWACNWRLSILRSDSGQCDWIPVTPGVCSLQLQL